MGGFDLIRGEMADLVSVSEIGRVGVLSLLLLCIYYSTSFAVDFVM